MCVVRVSVKWSVLVGDPDGTAFSGSSVGSAHGTS